MKTFGIASKILFLIPLIMGVVLAFLNHGIFTIAGWAAALVLYVANCLLDAINNSQSQLIKEYDKLLKQNQL